MPSCSRATSTNECEAISCASSLEPLLSYRDVASRSKSSDVSGTQLASVHRIVLLVTYLGNIFLKKSMRSAACGEAGAYAEVILNLRPWISVVTDVTLPSLSPCKVLCTLLIAVCKSSVLPLARVSLSIAS